MSILQAIWAERYTLGVLAIGAVVFMWAYAVTDRRYRARQELERRRVQWIGDIGKPGRRIPQSSKDVHTEHCCDIHGCKYGDATCSVARGEKQQSYPCEMCYYEGDAKSARSGLTHD